LVLRCLRYGRIVSEIERRAGVIDKTICLREIPDLTVARHTRKESLKDAVLAAVMTQLFGLTAALVTDRKFYVNEKKLE
jgi:hypothetical protein